jgi:hypothetical protein
MFSTVGPELRNVVDEEDLMMITDFIFGAIETTTNSSCLLCIVASPDTPFFFFFFSFTVANDEEEELADLQENWRDLCMNIAVAIGAIIKALGKKIEDHLFQGWELVTRVLEVCLVSLTLAHSFVFPSSSQRKDEMGVLLGSSIVDEVLEKSEEPVRFINNLVIDRMLFGLSFAGHNQILQACAFGMKLVCANAALFAPKALEALDNLHKVVYLPTASLAVRDNAAQSFGVIVRNFCTREHLPMHFAAWIQLFKFCTAGRSEEGDKTELQNSLKLLEEFIKQ